MSGKREQNLFSFPFETMVETCDVIHCLLITSLDILVEDLLVEVQPLELLNFQLSFLESFLNQIIGFSAPVI